VTQWEDWLVGLDNIGAVVQMRLQKTSRVYNFRSIYLVKMSQDAKIRKIDIFFGDQAAIERFFSW
jgi:hypothetical protein